MGPHTGSFYRRMWTSTFRHDWERADDWTVCGRILHWGISGTGRSTFAISSATWQLHDIIKWYNIQSQSAHDPVGHPASHSGPPLQLRRPSARSHLEPWWGELRWLTRHLIIKRCNNMYLTCKSKFKKTAAAATQGHCLKIGSWSPFWWQGRITMKKLLFWGWSLH